MNFTDGTPLANDETKQWITGLASGGGGGGGGAGSSPIDKAISQAKQTASEGDLQGAMTQLSKAVAQATTPVQKFKGRLQLAKLCVEQNLTDIALAQLEGLEKVADHHRLIDWEPALATDLYLNLYSVRRTATDQNDPEQRAKLATAFERLCQLDAGQALKVFQS
jgi:type VI secretion system protein VasJ